MSTFCHLKKILINFKKTKENSHDSTALNQTKKWQKLTLNYSILPDQTVYPKIHYKQKKPTFQISRKVLKSVF